MSIESLVIMLVVGGIAGWLASRIIKGRKYGIVGYVVMASSARSSRATSCRGSASQSAAISWGRSSMRRSAR